jgi:acetyl-CoA C-acetyltransferase
MPVQIYPLFESAWRASNGWTLAEDRRRIAELMARFSEVAAANPHAWRRQAYTPEQIDSPDDGNRFIGFPYRKLVNSNENVEQGAGIILTTVGKARALGVPEDRWVYALAGTEGADAPFVSNRVSFSDSGAVRIAGRRALELAATPAETLTHVDLYSCFPVAVQIAAHELGLSTDRDLTVTGGLPFAGGPWSNYVTHSVATMVERLRATGGTGLIFANGGYLTKHAFGVYATEPPRGGYAWERPQAEIDALGTVERADTYEGAATVESCTVMHDRADAPELAIITARLDDGRRAWGKSRDPEVMTLIETEEVVGRATKIDAEGTFAL